MGERQTGTRERRGEVELGARERYIGRREGAKVQGRPWGHRHRGRGNEGKVGEGRGGELTV